MSEGGSHDGHGREFQQSHVLLRLGIKIDEEIKAGKNFKYMCSSLLLRLMFSVYALSSEEFPMSYFFLLKSNRLKVRCETLFLIFKE